MSTAVDAGVPSRSYRAWAVRERIRRARDNILKFSPYSSEQWGKQCSVHRIANAHKVADRPRTDLPLSAGVGYAHQACGPSPRFVLAHIPAGAGDLRRRGCRILAGESGVELPQPDCGVEESPNHLVDVPSRLYVEPKIAVELLGFGSEFLCACGVLFWSHIFMLPPQRDMCCPPLFSASCWSETRTSPIGCTDLPPIGRVRRRSGRGQDLRDPQRLSDQPEPGIDGLGTANLAA
jgi:hypothetical protein